MKTFKDFLTQKPAIADAIQEAAKIRNDIELLKTLNDIIIELPKVGAKGRAFAKELDKIAEELEDDIENRSAILDLTDVLELAADFSAGNGLEDVIGSVLTYIKKSF